MFYNILRGRRAGGAGAERICGGEFCAAMPAEGISGDEGLTGWGFCPTAFFCAHDVGRCPQSHRSNICPPPE